MTAIRTLLSAAAAAAALAACSRPATQTAAVPAQPVVASAAPAAAAVATPAAVAPAAPAAGPPVAPGDPNAPAVAAAPANGFSCSFPGPGGRSILARFTLDGATARDDQGLAFTVLTNSPTALVLAHARDDTGAAPAGDIGAYVVAIDRRTLGMVQSTVGLNGSGATRRGRCIAG